MLLGYVVSCEYLPQEFPLWGTIKGYCIVLYCIVLYCIVLYCIVLYCIVLYCIVLYCIVLYTLEISECQIPNIFPSYTMFQVKIGCEGSCAQFGMVATADISEGEHLFEIPHQLLLTPDTSAIAQLLQKGKFSPWLPFQGPVS